MTNSATLDNEGCAWTVGVAGDQAFPTDFIGGASTTNTASIMDKTGTAPIPARPMAAQVIGFLVTNAAPAGTISFGRHSTVVFTTGAEYPATQVGLISLGKHGEGVRFDENGALHGSNICVRMTAGIEGIMLWRRLV